MSELTYLNHDIRRNQAKRGRARETSEYLFEVVDPVAMMSESGAELVGGDGEPLRATHLHVSKTAERGQATSWRVGYCRLIDGAVQHLYTTEPLNVETTEVLEPEELLQRNGFWYR